MITIITALLSITCVIVFFRIDQVTEILIGDGNSILERQNEIPLDPLDKNRLRDAVFRKNIYGVEEGIQKASKKEKELRIELNPTGPTNHLLPMFIKAKRYWEHLKIFLIIDIFLMIFLGVFLFLYEKKIIDYEILLWVGLLYFIFILYLSIFAVWKKTPHEKNKFEECKKLRS